MDDFVVIEDLSSICRVCLEKSDKMYPLVGPILNVDVDVLTMITYCTGVEVELDEDLPKQVCLPCFRTIRIAYNFINEFKEANEKLLELKESLKFKQENSLQAVKQENTLQAVKQENTLQQAIKEENNLQQDSDALIFSCNEDIMSADHLSREDENEVEVVIEEESESSEEEYEDEQSLEMYMDNTFSAADSEEKTQDLEEEKLEAMELEEKPKVTAKKKNYPQVSRKRKATITFYKCPICPKKTTKFHAVFVPHLYCHKGELFTCTICSSSPVMGVDEYVLHYKKIHLYQCEICDKSFSQKSTQHYHMKAHTENKSYPCSFQNCKKTFMTSWSLKKHMNTHSESVMYICSKCGRKFNTYDTFRYHQKTHDGNRSHLCPECGRSFLQSVHLKYHMWKHTGVKQFNCKKCSKSYTSVTQLKKHLSKYCGFDEDESTKA